MTVLCLVELDAGGAVADASLRALTFSRELAASAAPEAPGTRPMSHRSALNPSDATSDGLVAAAVFAPEAEVPAAALAAYGVTDAYAVESDQMSGYVPLAWARALAGLITVSSATAVVAAATDHGNEVIAHLAAILGASMAANCASAARAADGTYRLVRHRWAGSLLEDAVLDASPPGSPTSPARPGSPALPASPASPASPESPASPGLPALLTVAVDAVAATPAAEAAAIAVDDFRPELADEDLAVRATESAERAGGMSLATARVVVGGGRGVGGPEGFGALEELAGLLGGALGVSRVVTSQGWRPHKQQVGQTGTRISPELYLACGISGAIQHMAGCLSAKHIVAVNTDPDAPIIAHADYAVIGDLNQVIPALLTALRARSGLS